MTRPMGGAHYPVASYGFSQEFGDYLRNLPLEPGRGTIVGRTLLEVGPVQVADVLGDPEYTMSEGQRLGGFRTVLGVPLLREGSPIGVLALTRSTVRPFTEKQVELASTFADQAVIAIENVRLFQEVQARTEELSRSLKDLRTAQDRLIQAEKLQLSYKAAGDDRRFYFEKCCRKRVLTSNSKTEKTSPTPDQTQWLNTHNGERPD